MLTNFWNRCWEPALLLPFLQLRLSHRQKLHAYRYPCRTNCDGRLSAFADSSMDPALAYRMVAIIPALFTIVYFGEAATGKLLILSQVILSIQLGLRWLLLIFVSDKNKMKGVCNSCVCSDSCMDYCFLSSLSLMHVWCIVRLLIGYRQW